MSNFLFSFQFKKSDSISALSSVLWASWLGLFVLINVKFIPAFILILLHLYNLRYCQFEVDDCCEN